MSSIWIDAKMITTKWNSVVSGITVWRMQNFEDFQEVFMLSNSACQIFWCQLLPITNGFLVIFFQPWYWTSHLHIQILNHFTNLHRLDSTYVFLVDTRLENLTWGSMFSGSIWKKSSIPAPCVTQSLRLKLTGSGTTWGHTTLLYLLPRLPRWRDLKSIDVSVSTLTT